MYVGRSVAIDMYMYVSFLPRQARLHFGILAFGAWRHYAFRGSHHAAFGEKALG